MSRKNCMGLVLKIDIEVFFIIGWQCNVSSLKVLYIPNADTESKRLKLVLG